MIWVFTWCQLDLGSLTKNIIICHVNSSDLSLGTYIKFVGKDFRFCNSFYFYLSKWGHTSTYSMSIDEMKKC